MANAIDKAVRAQGGAVVKPHQVKALVIAARRAYAEQSKVGLVDDGVDFDAWRKATLHDVTGGDAPESFRTVTQRDYAAVLAYFGELAGERAEARRSDTIKVADERARALWALDLAEEEVAERFGGRGGARKYADALFWMIHGTERTIATPRQIWAVIFTLRKRAKARRSEGAKAPRPETRARKGPGARGEAGVHLPPPGSSKRFPAFSRGL